VALIAFTSGSTGHAKGVVLTHRGLLHGLMNMMLGAALNAEGRGRDGKANIPPGLPVSLLAAPFSHIAGFSQFLLMMHVGGRIVLLPEPDSHAARRLVHEETVTSLAGFGPDMIAELLDVPQELQSLRSIGIHGCSLTPTLLGDITAALPGANVCTGYGMTETAGSVCVISGATLLERPRSCGRSLPALDLLILRDGTEAPAGEVGEIAVRGAMLTPGYLGPGGTLVPAARDGWFRTGDLGCRDESGFLYVTDRAGNAFPCSAIEAGVLATRLTREVAAFGIPTPEGGAKLVNGFSSGREVLLGRSVSTPRFSG
jgi:long-chain acyl-CoA synthetase